MKNSIILFNIILIFLLLFATSNVYSYTDHAVTLDIPATVRANIVFEIKVNITGSPNFNTREFDLNVYSPRGGQPIFQKSGTGPETVNFNAIADLNTSSQPYLARVKLKDSDDNPSNDLYFKYFTVIRGEDRIPVSDVPIIAGVFIALIAGFIISSRRFKNIKKW